MRGAYKFPAHLERTLSASVKSLIREMLEPDPTLRITADQARWHKWVNVGYSEPPLRMPVATAQMDKGAKRDVLLVRADLLVLVEQMHGCNAEAVVESLIAHDVNQFSATYKMLEQKHPDPLDMDEWKLQQAWQVVDFVRERRGQNGLNLESMQLGARRRASQLKARVSGEGIACGCWLTRLLRLGRRGEQHSLSA
jgi:hypothetical protein